MVYSERIIRLFLIILILLLCCNYLITSFYYDFTTNSLFDWFDLGLDLFFLILSCILVARKNILGHLIALYFSYSSLSLNYNVNNSLFGAYFFANSPQSFLTNVMNLSILAFALFGLLIAIAQYFKPQLFQQTINLEDNKIRKCRTLL